LTNRLVNTAKTLRKSQTDAEKLLWKHLPKKCNWFLYTGTWMSSKSL